MNCITVFPARACVAALALALFTGVSLAATSTVDTSLRFRQVFAHPPAEYSTAPFFVWNGDVNERDVDRMLADYKSQGITAFFIHPRPGLITPYLSDRWFQLVKYTVDQGKKLGMEVWLYDENSYPSGFAGGHVPAEMPESYNQGQGLVPRKVTQLTAEAAAKCKLILQRVGYEYEVVNDAAEKGDYYCFELAYYDKRAWHGGFSYVDLLKPGVTQKFIDLTMRGYERSIGQDFAKTVPGIFTDEPNIIAPNRNAMRWTPDLFAQFQKRWNYDLRPKLPSLFQNIGDWERVRHNYYELLLELFIDRWSKPWKQYADSKNLLWTGHYWEHGWPSPVHGPDNMAMYAFHHVPGIDMLFNQFRTDVNAQFGNVRSVKELTSVANQLGRRRTLSETYGGGGWELRFEDMKRLGDWQAVLGVNLVNQHLSHGTLIGARKYDYPQSFTYHTPWWKQYHVLADYFARVSLACATGEQVNKILVIEPTSTVWSYAAIPTANPQMMQIGQGFQDFLNRLEALQVEYDLGSENIIKDHGKIAPGQFIVGRRRYDLVVLPPGTENLNSPTLRLLMAYTNGGGKILAFKEAPQRVDGGPLAFDVSRWIIAGSPDDPAARKLLANADFSQLSGDLFHQRRQLDDGQLLFFVNSSLEKPAHAVVKAPLPSVTQFDPMSGKSYVFHAAGGSITVDLPPAGSLLLVATKTPDPKAAAEAKPTAERKSPAGAKAPPEPKPALSEITGGAPVEPAKPLEARRMSPNALRIDYCDLKIGEKVERDIYFYKAQEAVFKTFGLETNPWNAAVQYKTSIVDKKIPEGSGFEATFYFDVDRGVDKAKLRAVVEQPALWSVSINGKPVSAEPKEWWLDVGFGVYDISGSVVDGKNSITVLAKQMSVFHELEPVFVTGDFGLAPQDRGWKLVGASVPAVGSWKTQNLPTYYDRVAYTASYKLKREGSRHAVQLGKWNGTLAEVRVNGKPAGTIFTQPYRLEITDLVATGENRVEVIVYGSLKNLIGPHHGKINRGLVSPGSFRSAPDHMPPGAKYDLEDYGLFEAFTVISSGSAPRSGH